MPNGYFKVADVHLKEKWEYGPFWKQKRKNCFFFRPVFEENVQLPIDGRKTRAMLPSLVCGDFRGRKTRALLPEAAFLGFCWEKNSRYVPIASFTDFTTGEILALWSRHLHFLGFCWTKNSRFIPIASFGGIFDGIKTRASFPSLLWRDFLMG